MKHAWKRGIAALVLGAVVAFPGIAYADETVQEEYAELTYPTMTRSTVDSSWDFDFSFTGATAEAPYWRSKDDYSSTYIGVSYKHCDRFMAYVDGASNSSGWDRLNCTQYGSAVVWSVGEFKIWNLVRENGKSYALLTGWANYEAGSAGGLWSPDCWNESAYQAINYTG